MGRKSKNQVNFLLFIELKSGRVKKKPTIVTFHSENISNVYANQPIRTSFEVISIIYLKYI